MSDERTIAVIGLGSMGYGIAASLLKAGHSVYGIDLDEAAATRFRDAGGAAGSAIEKAAEIDILVLVVLNAAQTEAVLFGDDGWAGRLSSGTTIVSCATVPPAFARDMATRAEARGLAYLDAPISGGAAKAAAGKLSIMASGSQAAFEGARPMLDACAETVFELGADPGQGSAMKAINQMLAGIHIAAMAEALTFGMTQDVDPAKVMEVIPKCAGTSWMFENRGPHVVDGDYSPKSSIDIWPKDLGIVLDIAKGAKFGAPVTAAALQQFLAASGSGLGAEDDAAVAKVYARNAGLTLPGGAS
ncbi:3-hydroxyisobutyrate dehydrogenase/2-hydroxy-3-oxopropionate reductase [Palleronia aestuarii]|uniref:L-threonate dehydrogenase n=1 Tax=Palleronia aestuarii TaxID=568105 RepID=A0A2W7NF31_9RHOB|nr:L-threonate dehydrogenase [Palleronia aestuarii]PZX19041.1 3-hydroxyisobutyrate dehydrogenase/2-hydroxy-3-oxopropionate reductase [Palleronia aestuarii]